MIESNESAQVYYHVASEAYEEGDDLLCYDEIERLTGEPPAWKWEGEPFDTDIICLFETLDDAREFAADYGGRILRVTLPEDVRVGRNSEGYSYVATQIDARSVSPIG